VTETSSVHRSVIDRLDVESTSAVKCVTPVYAHLVLSPVFEHAPAEKKSIDCPVIRPRQRADRRVARCCHVVAINVQIVVIRAPAKPADNLLTRSAGVDQM